jgi:FAD/FMN-containing dehydrogenase
MNSIRKTIAGWGRFPREECTLFRPEKQRDLQSLAQERSTLLARGLGRAYGDAALNESSTILQERFNHFLEFDEATGILECEGGVSLAEIIAVFLPRGWFLPVSPGTKFVTAGGALACDIHGKNHHAVGAFSNFVEAFDLLIASGQTLHCSHTENAEVFWATIGGMGLTGIITRVRLRLLRVESAYIKVETERLENLNLTLNRFQSDDNYQYSVAWIDCLATGDSLGRAVLMRGHHAAPHELSTPALRATPLETPQKKSKSVPLDFPDFALNPFSVKAFNAAYYAAHPTKTSVVDFDSFFYPLDAIENWNRIYGARGFIQYQVALPHENSRAGLTELLEKISGSGHASFLAVLKTFGKANAAPLSFPFAGHTLALDIPMTDDLPGFARELDAITLKHNGRVYLAKDALLSPENFRAMYPRYQEWRAIKTQLDPHEKFASALSRRLKITAN